VAVCVKGAKSIEDNTINKIAIRMLSARKAFGLFDGAFIKNDQLYGNSTCFSLFLVVMKLHRVGGLG
jgi:hypothetical protein